MTRFKDGEIAIYKTKKVVVIYSLDELSYMELLDKGYRLYCETAALSKVEVNNDRI